MQIDEQFLCVYRETVCDLIGKYRVIFIIIIIIIRQVDEKKRKGNEKWLERTKITSMREQMTWNKEILKEIALDQIVLDQMEKRQWGSRLVICKATCLVMIKWFKKIEIKNNNQMEKLPKKDDTIRT